MASFDELNRMLSNTYAQMGSPNSGGPGNPGGVYNSRPGVGTLPYYNTYVGQNPGLGRYRPPTLGADGSNPNNWNDYGGYAYNLPNNFGPNPFTWTGSPYPQQQQYQYDRRASEEAPRMGIPSGEYTRGGHLDDYISQLNNTLSSGPDPYYDYGAKQAATELYGNPDPAAQERIRQAIAARRGLGAESPVGGRGPAYVGPQETHVGGPSSGAKPPPAPVQGGVKGPMPVEEQYAALDDWQWRGPRNRRFRSWGRG